MKITRMSPISGVTRTMDIPATREQIKDWEQGTPIQKAMPNLTDDQREFLLTGITAEEWDEVFPEEGEEDITAAVNYARKYRDEILQEWVRRLKDTPYDRRGVGRLRECGSDRMCALGHLCEMFIERGFGTWVRPPGGTDVTLSWSLAIGREGTFIPRSIEAALGLEKLLESNRVYANDPQTLIYVINDSEMSLNEGAFDTVADLIEKYVLTNQ